MQVDIQLYKLAVMEAPSGALYRQWVNYGCRVRNFEELPTQPRARISAHDNLCGMRNLGSSDPLTLTLNI